MAAPLVVIVGRPNVGKSTLFNRLTQSKSAIVDDSSGVTRDRLYGEVDWNGRIFKLIDTGGYVPETEDLFEIAIRDQIYIAIQEADAVLLVTDGRVGLTPVDKDVANILRAADKPSFVLVNKADNETLGLLKNDFYSLGIKNLFDISALSGRNIGDVLDELISVLPKLSEIEEDTRLRLAIVGRPNVGKSSLVNSLSGIDRSIVTNIAGTTRDSLNTVVKYYGEEIVLVDTAGMRRKTKVKESIEFYSNVRTLRAISDCDVAIILLDAEQGLEKQDQRIIQEAVQRRKGIILAVNKWDLIEKDNNTTKEFESEIRNKLGSINYIPIIFISALTKQRIFKLIELSKKIQAERIKNIPTKLLNDTLLPDFAQTPPPATGTGREVKIKFINQVGDKYPIFLLFSNYPKSVPDNYRRFVEATIRKHFGFYGVPMTVTFKEK